MSPLRLLAQWMSTVFAPLVGLSARQHVRAPGAAQASYAALQESEQRLQAMFDQAAVGVALVDMETNSFARVNQKYCDILGYTREELQGQDVRSVSNADDYADNLALRDRMRRGEISSFHLEKRQMRKDGTTIWIDLTVAVVLQAGDPPKYNMGVIQDITERRLMQDSLRHNEERLRSILDHLPVGILLSERGERITFRNRNFTRMTRYTDQDLGMADDWWLRAFPDPQARQQARQRWQGLRREAADHDSLIARQEYDIRCADGVQRSMAISGVLLGRDEIVIFEDLSPYKAAEEQINYLAYYDPLTGLANRRLLLDRLSDTLVRSARRKQCGAVLMFDLDRFKMLNETRGHDRGDLLLRKVARRLGGLANEEDTLARHGGGTFVLVLSAASDGLDRAAAHAGEVGERILTLMRSPFLLDGEPYHTTVSIGAIVFQGQQPDTETLLQRVDVAMYQAKAEGRDTLVFYDPRVQERVKTRARLEASLRVGLARGQFEPYYQAQVHEGRIVGAEALIRWHHPSDGLILPSRFIPLAEETGLILPLGTWMLQAACRQLAAWETHRVFSTLTLAVNISAMQFRQADFVAQVLDTLTRAAARPNLLKLELTEGVLLHDIESTIAKMEQLKAHGIHLSLDDFGIGYSSLAYLKRLPLDQLKIDQSFIHDVLCDPNDAAIVRTVVTLGGTLGLNVIAEGVETEDQRAFLHDQGCLSWQGYLLSQAVPVQAFEALVRDAGQSSAAGMGQGRVP